MSENPRPASTPPTLASREKEEGEEEKIAAELEVKERLWIMLIRSQVPVVCFSTNGKTPLFWYLVCL